MPMINIALAAGRAALSLTIAFFVLVLVAMAVPARANLVFNSNFETMNVSTGSGAGSKYCPSVASGTACMNGSSLFMDVNNDGPNGSNVAGWGVSCVPGGVVTPCSVNNQVLTVVFPIAGNTGFSQGTLGFGNHCNDSQLAAACNTGLNLYGPAAGGANPNGYIPVSPAGGNYVAGDGDPNFEASFSQTITGLTIGGTYTLTFYQAGTNQRSINANTFEQWQVTFGSNTQLSTVMNTGDGANSGGYSSFSPWSQQTMTFTATSASQVLTFMSSGTSTGALPPIALLDGVDLENATPEPSAILLVGGGLAGLMAIGSARRKRGKPVA